MKMLAFGYSLFGNSRFMKLALQRTAMTAVWLLLAAALGAAQDFKVIATINVDVQPFGATLSPDGKTVWVANCGQSLFGSGIRRSTSSAQPGNTVTIIDVATLTEEPNKITVGSFPEDIAFAHDGRQALVSNSSDNTISVIDTESRTVTQTVSINPLGLAFPFGITVSRNGDRAFISTDGQTSLNSIGVLNIQDRDDVRLDGTIVADLFTGRMSLRPGTNELAVSASVALNGPPALQIVDPAARKVKRQLSIPGNTGLPQDVVITPDGRFAYVALDDFSGGTGGVWVVDLDEMETVTIINTGDPNVIGMGITPNGRFVFATNFVANSVVAIDTRTNRIVATIPVGNQPNKVAVTLDNKTAFVANEGDTTVSVIRIDRD